MFTSPISLTYDGVATNLHRVNNDNYASTYYGKDSVNNRIFTLLFRHRLPKGKGLGEGHTATLNVERYDTDGNLVKDTVFVTLQCDTAQDDAALEKAYNAAVAAMTTVTVSAFLGRQS
nr:MAG: hypothetical protein 2 [Leviviridae sp.]